MQEREREHQCAILLLAEEHGIRKLPEGRVGQGPQRYLKAEEDTRPQVQVGLRVSEADESG